MSEFSLQECMKKLNIQEGARLDKLQQLYCNLDRLILNERAYLNTCIFERFFEKASEVDRDVWRGIMLRALKMSMESELGGAIKQDIQFFDTPFSDDNQGISGKIYWASIPERPFEFAILSTINEQQKAQAREELANGKISEYCNVLSLDNDNIQDAKRQFDSDCDLMDLDAISVKSAFCYQRGIGMNLQMALEDDDMIDKLETEWVSYQKLSPQERADDFNRFVEEIRYVNELAPRPINRHNDSINNNNQNQR